MAGMSGYVIVDGTGLATAKATQTVPGLFSKLSAAFNTNKLTVVANVDVLTPLAGAISAGSTAQKLNLTLPGFTAVVDSTDHVVQSN